MYVMTIRGKRDFADGTSSTHQVTLFSGRYGWQPRAMSLAAQGVTGGVSASLSGANVVVHALGHTYQFLAAPLP
jgi:hypothetical protein